MKRYEIYSELDYPFAAESLKGDWCKWSDVAGLEKENARLREALERIASNKADDAMRVCIREGVSYHRILEDIAQAALEEK